MPEACHNPLCAAPIPDGGRRPRRFCDKHCRLIHWVLKKAATLLLPLGIFKAWRLLSALDAEGRGK